MCDLRVQLNILHAKYLVAHVNHVVNIHSSLKITLFYVNHLVCIQDILMQTK
jgi:hypothetical protein